MEKGTLGRTAGGFIQALMPDHGGGGAGIGLAIAKLRPTDIRIVLVALAMDQTEHLLGGATNVGGGSGEFPLVLVVHRDRHAEHRHCLGAGPPSKIRVGEQLVVALERGEVVTVSITMTLREHALGIGGINISVGGA